MLHRSRPSEASSLESRRSIPSLDGLRAVAILLVLLCHLQGSFPGASGISFIARCGSLGVNIFFVISGYLITRLLMQEQDRADRIDLRRFALRRAFRIFPPFYVYLAAALAIRLLHPEVFRWSSLVSAATYTWNYNLHADGWLLGHSWSLSLEEQFYLFWPAVMAVLSRRACLRFALVAIAISPVLRVVTYFAFPALRGHIDLMLPTHLDTLMVGCAMALVEPLGSMAGLRHAAARPRWVILSLLVLLVACPWLETRYRGAFYLPFGITLTSLGCGVAVHYAMHQPFSRMGRVLNTSPLRHIGVLSYSLYLWQQMFTGERTRLFPLNLVFIFLCAELSYRLVERPSLLLRDRLLRTGADSRVRLPRGRTLVPERTGG